MPSLADYIEQYIRRLIDEARTGFVELQRRELAEKFGCVPSQINYVLSTRFTLEQGYMVETRRGGGGYIRIVRIRTYSRDELLGELAARVGEAIDEESAWELLERLEAAGLIDPRQRLCIKAAIIRGTQDLPEESKGYMRARLLVAMLEVLRNDL